MEWICNCDDLYHTSGASDDHYHDFDSAQYRTFTFEDTPSVTDARLERVDVLECSFEHVAFHHDLHLVEHQLAELCVWLCLQ